MLLTVKCKCDSLSLHAAHSLLLNVFFSLSPMLIFMGSSLSVSGEHEQRCCHHSIVSIYRVHNVEHSFNYICTAGLFSRFGLVVHAIEFRHWHYTEQTYRDKKNIIAYITKIGKGLCLPSLAMDNSQMEAQNGWKSESWLHFL